jgi:hypothetical protein
MILAHNHSDIKRVSRHSTRPVPIRVNNRRVGVVDGDVFRKKVHGSKHQLWRPPAWAADIDNLHAAREAGARHIEIVDMDTGSVYRTSIARMLADGFPVNRGYGAQVALALPLWDRPDLDDQLPLLSASEADR